MAPSTNGTAVARLLRFVRIFLLTPEQRRFHRAARQSGLFDPDYYLGANPMIHDLMEETIDLSDGMIAIPDKPGLGFTISEKFLEAHAVKP